MIVRQNRSLVDQYGDHLHSEGETIPIVVFKTEQEANAWITENRKWEDSSIASWLVIPFTCISEPVWDVVSKVKDLQKELINV
jgi:hypothetical protein